MIERPFLVAVGLPLFAVVALAAGLLACNGGSADSGGLGAASATGDEVAQRTGNSHDGSGGVADPDAAIEPDLLVVEPHVAAPGSIVELRYPLETLRGVAFVLERRVGDAWSTTHLLTSGVDGYGDGSPGWAPYDDPEYGVEDVGIGGAGPDLIEIPSTAGAGEYRICTANAAHNFCAELQIES